MRVLLVNPPIYDFAAYDFWLKPYGMLKVAGFLRHAAELSLFDYLDREHPLSQAANLRRDAWQRGSFLSQEIEKPTVFRSIPRKYHRFGLPRQLFRQHLQENGPFDVVLIQSVMTYWYLGIAEVIEDIKTYCPQAKTVLGGVYATLCGSHAKQLSVALILNGSKLEPLWQMLGVEPDVQGLPYWEGYPELKVGVLKLAQGCPFRCSYCSVPKVDPRFYGHPQESSLRAVEMLINNGVTDIAFYDDALLYQPEHILSPFLKEFMKRHGDTGVHFHTPNALNARFITEELAELMIESGFKTFHLGFESSAYEWHRHTDRKVYSHELERAVERLVAAGAKREYITAYLIMGHPQGELQNVEASIRFVQDVGIRCMLAEFSPIPGTPDGEACRRWVDLDEPLWHNKTAFPIIRLGWKEVQRLKGLAHEANRTVLERSAGSDFRDVVTHTL